METRHSPRRQKGAYGNGEVGNLKKKIEDVFDLPKGAVQITKSNGKKAHPKAKVRNFKKNY